MGNKKQRNLNKLNRKQRIGCFSYNWADSQLRYIIGVLQGNHVECSRKGRIHLAIIAKELLKEHGYTWHVERIDNWIHRTSKLEQPLRADLSREAEKDSQNKKREIKYLGDLFI